MGADRKTGFTFIDKNASGGINAVQPILAQPKDEKCCRSCGSLRKTTSSSTFVHWTRTKSKVVVSSADLWMHKCSVLISALRLWLWVLVGRSCDVLNMVRCTELDFNLYPPS